MNNQELEDDLARSLIRIDRQLARVHRTAHELGCDISDVKDVDGRYTLVPLLEAKIKALHALALVRTLN